MGVPHEKKTITRAQCLELNAMAERIAEEDIAKDWNRDLLLNAIKLKMHESHAVVPVDNNLGSLLFSF